MSDNSFKEKNILSYKIELDINKDAWNWYDACAGEGSHGMDWSKRAPVEVVKNVRNKSRNEAYEYIDKYLKNKYSDEKDKIERGTEFIKSRYEKDFLKACQKLESVIGKPIYRNDFTIYLTTFQRAPYNYHEGLLYTCVDWVKPIAVLMHELSHFQFIHYWRNNPNSPVSELSFAEFEWLKESLTIILDEDFFPLIEAADSGYELHKKFRDELRVFWMSNHDFDKLVDSGISLLPKYKNEIENSVRISTYEKVKTPDDLLTFMSQNIHYGFINRDGRKYFDADNGWNRDWYNTCIIQNGSELLKTKCGTCWDQVELERKWFAENNYDFKTIFIWFNIKEPSNYPTHTFLAFYKNNKWHWFENSFYDYRGIHEYDSLDTLIDDVVNKHLKAAVESGVAKPADIKLIKKYEYTQPKPDLGVDEYINFVTKNEI